MIYGPQEKLAKTLALFVAITLAVVGAALVNRIVRWVDGPPPHTKYHIQSKSVQYVLPEVSLSDSTVPEHFVF